MHFFDIWKSFLYCGYSSKGTSVTRSKCKSKLLAVSISPLNWNGSKNLKIFTINRIGNLFSHRPASKVEKCFFFQPLQEKLKANRRLCHFHPFLSSKIQSELQAIKCNHLNLTLDWAQKLTEFCFTKFSLAYPGKKHFCFLKNRVERSAN